MPVYNVRHYLDEAIDSVLDQDLDSIELLLIDDGSTDGSGELADQRAELDSRIRVVHQENGGLANARNTGVRHAGGEYISFLDSDDCTTKSGFKTMVDTLDETGSDYITGQMLMWTGNRKRKSELHLRSHNKWRKKTNIHRHPDIVFDSTVTNKVIRRSFWESSGASFPEGKLYEDFIPSATLFTKARSFDVMPDPMYLWRIRTEGGSITQQRHETKNLHDRLEMTYVVRDMVKQVPNGEAAMSALNYKNVWVDLKLYRPWKFGSAVSSEYRDEWLGGARRILAEVEPNDLDGLDVRTKLEMYLVSQDRYDDTLRLQTWYDHEIAGEPTVEITSGQVLMERSQLPFDTSEIPDWVLNYNSEVQLEGWIESIDWLSDSKFRVKGRAYSTKVAPAAEQTVEIALVSLDTNARIPLETTQIESETVNTRTRDTTANHARAGFECIVDLARIPGSKRFEKWGFEATVTSPLDERQRLLPFTKAHHGRVPNIPVEFNGRSYYFTSNTAGPMRLVTAKPAVRIQSIEILDNSICVEFDLAGPKQLNRVWLQNTATQRQIKMRVSKTNGKILALIDLPQDSEATWAVTVQRGFKRPQRARVDQHSHVGAGVISSPHVSASVFEFTGLPVAATNLMIETPASISVKLEGQLQENMELGIGFDDSSVRDWVPVTSFETPVQIPLSRTSYDGTTRPIKKGNYRLFARLQDDQSQVYAVPAHPSQDSQSRVLTKSDGIVQVWITDRNPTGCVGILIDTVLPDDELTRFGRASIQRQWQSAENIEPLDSVLFYDYFGRAQIDSSYYIFQEIHKRKLGVDCYFAVADLSVPVPEGAEPVLLHSAEWFELQQRCRYIFANITLDRTMPKPKFQTFVQLWHGTPLKHIAATVWHKKASLRLARQDKESNDWDYLVSQSPFATEILKGAFLYDGPILETGYPRNDPLYETPLNRRDELLTELGIDPTNKTLLYAPTFRDTNTKAGFKASMTETLDLDGFIADLDPEWTVLVRGHGLVAASDQVLNSGNRVVDVTQVPNINDLYQASDLLVTDYSSAVFDYSVTGKPFLLFTPDLEEYRDSRGLYVDLKEFSPIPLIRTQQGLVEAIENLDELVESHQDDLARFRETYVPWDIGTAAKQVVDAVFT